MRDPHSEETRRKIPEILKGKYRSGEIIHPMKGKHHSEENRRLLSERAPSDRKVF